MSTSNPVKFERYAEPIPTGLGALDLNESVVEFYAVAMGVEHDTLQEFCDNFWIDVYMGMELVGDYRDTEGNFPASLRAAVGLLLQECDVNVELPEKIKDLANKKFPFMHWDNVGVNNGCL